MSPTRCIQFACVIVFALVCATAYGHETVVERDVKPGDPDRAVIMDALRPRFEKLFGAPIVFRVNVLVRAGDYVYANTHAMRAVGKEIETERWKRYTGSAECFATRLDFGFENILEKRDGLWRIIEENSGCASDSIVEIFRRKAGIRQSPEETNNQPWDEDSHHCWAHIRSDSLDLFIDSNDGKAIVLYHNENWDNAPLEPVVITTDKEENFKPNANKQFFGIPPNALKAIVSQTPTLRFWSAQGYVLTTIATNSVNKAVDFVASCNAKKL